MEYSSSSDFSAQTQLPRVLIVSRRTLRKNKFVDFVGEYHLDLIVQHGAVPVIVPRVAGVGALLESFEPIHGVLLCEGEDVDPSLYDSGDSDLTPEDLQEIRRLHASDSAIDHEKDSIEFRLVKLCLDRNIPYLGICRGCHVLNVACGGTLYQDVEKELAKKADVEHVVHMDYNNYDGHRHKVAVVENTPMYQWFQEEEEEVNVNSYHHQGVKRLAERFAPMAFAADGLVEGYFDPDNYYPDLGKFLVGLQFHPERMRQAGQDKLDHPACSTIYQEFVKAVVAYKKRRETMARNCVNESDIEAGEEFLESIAALSLQQEKRLKQMGATVRNASGYMERARRQEEKGSAARNVMEKMSMEQLSELLSFYRMMGKVCSDVLEGKLAESMVDVGRS